jgi:hypothetical protein
MRPFPIALTMLALGWAAPTARPADLKKVDRTIVKEPKYTSQPYYALLVFGPEAKARAWLVVDGEVLYVDRNGNGDLTEANERIELDRKATDKIKVAPGEYKGMNVFNLEEVAGTRLTLQFWVRDKNFTPKDGKDEHEILAKYRKERRENGWENASLHRMGKDGTQAQIPVLLCRKPGDAQVSHLGGPLTFTVKWGDRQALKRGAGENVFDVNIGTPGLGTRNSRYPVFAPLTTGEVPAALHAVARFEFPNQAAGKPPIKLEVKLNQRC